MSISATIKSVQDIMRQDAGVDGDAQRISQLVWMLFLKVFDSKEKEWDALSDDYTYIIPDGLRWSDSTRSTLTRLLTVIYSTTFTRIS